MKNKKSKKNAVTLHDADGTEIKQTKLFTGKGWTGVIIIGGRTGRATVMDFKNPMPIAKLRALMDREFKDDAPHDVFGARRDDSVA